MRRGKVITDYRTPRDTATRSDDAVTVSTVAQ
jgi:hypothetical protein